MNTKEQNTNILILDGDERFDSEKVANFLKTDSRTCPARTIYHRRENIKFTVTCKDEAYAKDVVVQYFAPYNGQWNPANGTTVSPCPTGCGSGRCVRQRIRRVGAYGKKRKLTINPESIVSEINISNICCFSDYDINNSADRAYREIRAQKTGEAEAQIMVMVNAVNSQPIQSDGQLSQSEAGQIAASMGGCASSASVNHAVGANPWRRMPSKDRTCQDSTETSRVAEYGPETAPAGSCGGTSSVVGISNFNF